MSLQDDIFDVRDALKKKPEAASFARIEGRFNELEQEYEKAMVVVRGVNSAVNAFNFLRENYKC
jgi:hypothetical protein